MGTVIGQVVLSQPGVADFLGDLRQGYLFVYDPDTQLQLPPVEAEHRFGPFRVRFGPEPGQQIGFHGFVAWGPPKEGVQRYPQGVRQRDQQRRVRGAFAPLPFADGLGHHPQLFPQGLLAEASRLSRSVDVFSQSHSAPPFSGRCRFTMP